MMAGILFILGRMHPGIICYDNDHPCVHTRVGCGIHRIGSHIHADMFHGAHTALAGQSCAKRNFHGHFLVRRPFTVNVPEQGDLFRNLCTGSARITGCHTASAFIQAARQCLVAQHQFLHSFSLPFCDCAIIFSIQPVPSEKTRFTRLIVAELAPVSFMISI